MDNIQKTFKKIFPKKIHALKLALHNFEYNPEVSLESIRRILHSIKNTAISYGFKEIGEKAEQVDQKEGEELIAALGEFLNNIEQTLTLDQENRTRILLVDDDELTTELVDTVLSSEGYDILTASTMNNAEAKLMENEIALIIMEIVLEDGDGRNFLLNLKSRTNTNNIPVIIVSEESKQPIQEECLAIGADDFIEKPFDISSFTKTVNKIINTVQTQETGIDQGQIPNQEQLIQKFNNYRSEVADDEFYTLAIIDVDNYLELINEHGKDIGYRLLDEYSKLIDSKIDSEKYFGHWYGDEFVLIFPNIEEIKIAKRLQAFLDFMLLHTFNLDHQAIKTTFSAACKQFSIGLDVEKAYIKVSSLVNEVKARGKSQILCSERCGSIPQRKILLAEEDEIVSSLIVHRLEKEDFKVVHIETGPEVLEKLTSDPSYSLVILDVKLPEMGGFEVIERIRGNSIIKNIPVIILTAMGKEHDVIHGLEVGANDYMVKPFSPLELLARIQRYLRKHSKKALQSSDSG